MSLAAGTTAIDRQPSPNRLTAFSSNNPFRNRAASPSPQTTTFPESVRRAPPPPPAAATMSKNPFLDTSEVMALPAKANGANNSSGLTADIFKDLSLLDKPASNGAPLIKTAPPQRAGTLPPTGAHRPTASDDRRPPRPSRGPESPSKREHRPRPRGMSESLVVEDKERRDRRERERGERPERTESEERRRRERRKEREERHRREKEKIRKGPTPAKRQQGLDIIDKLDVTGIYGQGLFHHDGPFDACNPHRNKGKSSRPAPMQAFPEGSANMALGGSGPVRSRLDLDKFHGRGEEGFSEYAATRKADTAIINPTDRIEQVHGDETNGLGTSTFLEGAPASKRALQRRESEDQSVPEPAMGGGLGRKKSLAQRFRGMSASRNNGMGGDFRSPTARYGGGGDAFDTSPPQHNKAISAGGPLRARFTKENETNPFDTEYDSAFDKKGAQIRIAEQEKPAGMMMGRPRAPSSPKDGLVRSPTAEASAVRGASNEEDRAGTSGGGGGGFLNRMRSLKGGRRTRPERRDT
ncbi:hypothetical protein LTR36_009474 [Oleoguttula mirabilis]|uniref:Pal1-domain-containing protein n=1 Tax=Oleoguttula mirabilis TaxID=1507867 RepID=A0AAV9JSS5_9PEZI|nr:hypothetical protein LTR36_009474 [Oleoguttula mirabilis]